MTLKQEWGNTSRQVTDLGMAPSLADEKKKKKRIQVPTELVGKCVKKSSNLARVTQTGPTNSRNGTTCGVRSSSLGSCFFLRSKRSGFQWGCQLHVVWETTSSGTLGNDPCILFITVEMFFNGSIGWFRSRTQSAFKRTQYETLTVRYLICDSWFQINLTMVIKAIYSPHYWYNCNGTVT